MFCGNGTTRFKNVNNCMNINIYSYLETSGGQSSNPHLHVVDFLNTIADEKSIAACLKLFSCIGV